MKKSENNQPIIGSRGYLFNRAYQKKKVKDGKTIKMGNKTKVMIE